jgi:hypothetical protein
MLIKKFLEKPSVLIVMDDISEGLNTRSPIEEKTDEAIRNRLGDLIKENWNGKDVRLIAWDEEVGKWQMWEKA